MDNVLLRLRLGGSLLGHGCQLSLVLGGDHVLFALHDEPDLPPDRMDLQQQVHAKSSEDKVRDEVADSFLVNRLDVERRCEA